MYGDGPKLLWGDFDTLRASALHDNLPGFDVLRPGRFSESGKSHFPHNGLYRGGGAVFRRIDDKLFEVF